MIEAKRLALIAAFIACIVMIVANTNQRSNQMMTPADLYINGDSTHDVFQACNQVVGQLPVNVRTRFTDIRLEYLAAYGIDRACDKLRGKSVQQIIDEYVPSNLRSTKRPRFGIASS